MFVSAVARAVAVAGAVGAVVDGETAVGVGVGDVGVGADAVSEASGDVAVAAVTATATASDDTVRFCSMLWFIVCFSSLICTSFRTSFSCCSHCFFSFSELSTTDSVL